MARINYVLVLIALVIVVAGVGCSEKKYMQYDGYYSNKKDPNKVHMYLKFYADGTVTAALPVSNATGVYALRFSELDKDNIKECTIRGKYSLKGNKVAFKLVDKNGSAEFSGDFQKNKVLLKSHSYINGKDSFDSYDFYKINK